MFVEEKDNLYTAHKKKKRRERGEWRRMDMRTEGEEKGRETTSRGGSTTEAQYKHLSFKDRIACKLVPLSHFPKGSKELASHP